MWNWGGWGGVVAAELLRAAERAAAAELFAGVVDVGPPVVYAKGIMVSAVDKEPERPPGAKAAALMGGCRVLAEVLV